MNASKLTMTIHRLGSAIKKSSPTILTISGMIGVGGSYYLLWKSAKKHNDIAVVNEENLAAVREKRPLLKKVEEDGTVTEVVNPNAPANYTDKDYKKELAIEYLKSGANYVKLYGTSALAATASLASIGAGFGILRRRNLATLAACATAERTLKRYRNRVIEELGADADRKFRFGIKDEYVETPVLDKNGEQKVDKEGNPKTKVEKLQVVENLPNGYSEYAVVFDETCPEFQKGDPEYNKATLQAREKYFNELIRARARSDKKRPAGHGIGVVTLNEVLKELQLPLKRSGQFVGWTYFEDPTEAVGDNYISFGIFDVFNHIGAKEKAEFINGYRSSVVLDFNVDGMILDYI